MVTLLANCDELVHTYLSTISYGLTYTQLAERLHSFIESSNNRATSFEKNEIIADANLAIDKRLLSLEAQLLEFKTKLNAKNSLQRINLLRFLTKSCLSTRPTLLTLFIVLYLIL